MESESQKRANRKWKSNNKKRARVYVYKSSAKLFISKYATFKDIKMFKNLLNHRKEYLLKK